MPTARSLQNKNKNWIGNTLEFSVNQPLNNNSFWWRFWHEIIRCAIINHLGIYLNLKLPSVLPSSVYNLAGSWLRQSKGNGLRWTIWLTLQMIPYGSTLTLHTPRWDFLSSSKNNIFWQRRQSVPQKEGKKKPSKNWILWFCTNKNKAWAMARKLTI